MITKAVGLFSLSTFFLLHFTCFHFPRVLIYAAEGSPLVSQMLCRFALAMIARATALQTLTFGPNEDKKVEWLWLYQPGCLGLAGCGLSTITV